MEMQLLSDKFHNLKLKTFVGSFWDSRKYFWDTESLYIVIVE